MFPGFVQRLYRGNQVRGFMYFPCGQPSFVAQASNICRRGMVGVDRCPSFDFLRFYEIAEVF